MAGKGDGEGEGNVLKLENQISVIKYVLLFTNVLEWVSYCSLDKTCPKGCLCAFCVATY